MCFLILHLGRILQVASMISHLLAKIASSLFISDILLSLLLLIGVALDVARPWYRRQRMRYAFAERMFVPGIDGADVGGFVGL